MALRKRLTHTAPPADVRAWLNLEQLAEVELTSEDPGHPIDAALAPDSNGGWRASQPGEQRITIRFDEPQTLSRIRLVFDETERERVQECVLRWSADGGRSYEPIVRQQFTFSPSGATREVEEYAVRLDGVTAVELQIVPDLSGGAAVASLRELRMR